MRGGKKRQFQEWRRVSPYIGGKIFGKISSLYQTKILPHKLASQTSEINKALCKEGSAPSFLSPFLSSKERDEYSAMDLASFLAGLALSQLMFDSNKLFTPFLIILFTFYS